MCLERRKHFVDTSWWDLDFIHVWKWTWSFILHSWHVLIPVKHWCKLVIQHVGLLLAAWMCNPVGVFQWGYSSTVVPLTVDETPESLGVCRGVRADNSVDVITVSLCAGCLSWFLDLMIFSIEDRGPDVWKSLPNSVKHCSSLYSFKASLKKLLYRSISIIDFKMQ